MLKAHWQAFEISDDHTHHLVDHHPAYQARFLSVLKFHEPGLAAANDKTGAFHIHPNGESAYPDRYIRTFGFYEGRAAVQSLEGCFHLLPNGRELYKERYFWCGNFQKKFCVVKSFEGNFFHINLEGKKSYPHSFRYAGDFHDGYAVVQNAQGVHTHIFPNGDLLHRKWFKDLDVYHKGFARAKNEKGWFHIDLEGNPIYDERYENIEPFYNGIARVQKHEGGLYLINEKGDEVALLREPTQDAFHQVSGELVSYWRFYTIQAANELQLFEHLPHSTLGLSKLILISEKNTRRLLQALEEMGYVKKTDDDLWLPTPKGAFFHSHHPFSMKEAANLWKDEHLSCWQHLLFSLKTDKPAFDHLYGKGWFNWLKDHKGKTLSYHRVLSKYAKRDYQSFCSLVDLSPHQSLLDLGGSSGTLLIDILNKNPHLKGILFDLPNVIKIAKIPSNLEGRMELISGDFFGSWPPFTVESAVLSRVLHDWPDNKAIEILKHVHLRLSDKTQNRIYILENILNETSSSGALLDLNMLAMTGGCERNITHFSHLLKKADFSLETIYPLNQASSILVAKKSSFGVAATNRNSQDLTGRNIK